MLERYRLWRFGVTTEDLLHDGLTRLLKRGARTTLAKILSAPPAERRKRSMGYVDDALRSAALEMLERFQAECAARQGWARDAAMHRERAARLAPDPAAVVADRDEHELLQRRIRALLGSREWELFRRVVLERELGCDAARAMGMSATAGRAMLRRILKKIREDHAKT
jgi:hypothetical protein